MSVEWRQGAWSVEVEGVTMVSMASLDDVAARVHELAGRHDGHQGAPVGLSVKLRLPASVRARLDLAERYEREGTTTGSNSYRRGMTAMARAARCGAARELIALGVDMRDVSVVLGTSVDQTRELVA